MMPTWLLNLLCYVAGPMLVVLAVAYLLCVLLDWA